jgi:RNA polymerase primary sigma factor
VSPVQPTCVAGGQPPADTLGMFSTASAVYPRAIGAAESARLAHAVEVGLFARARLLARPSLPADDRRDLERLDEEGRYAYGCLVISNLGLVAALAGRIRVPGAPFADLMQSGVVGLIQAVMRWDHRRGFAFSTYAAFWIRQTMLRGLADELHLIRIPAELAASLGHVPLIRSRLTQERGREPSGSEIAQSLGVAVDRLAAAQAVAGRPAALDPDHPDPVDPALPTPDELVARRLLPAYLDNALDVLAGRDAGLLRLRFGLEDGVWRSYDEVATMVGLTRERVRILVRRALEQIRDGPYGAGLRSYLT